MEVTSENRTEREETGGEGERQIGLEERGWNGEWRNNIIIWWLRDIEVDKGNRRELEKFIIYSV